MSAIDTIVATLVLGIDTDNVTVANITGIIISLMTAVEQYKSLSGVEKKAVVVRALEVIVGLIADETDDDESKTKLVLEAVLQRMLPSLIDAIIEIENGNLRVRESVKSRLCGWC
jgi:type III secretory pathway component EscS